jgi:hypothetical protein
MNRIITFLLAIVAVGLLETGCKSKAKPLSEIIARAWVAQNVKEGSALVYTKGGANNQRPAYTNWRLDLSSPTTVTYKEFDGNSFTGQWEIKEGTSNTLILKNLTPQPTGTNGTIEFTISSASESELILIRTTASQKTGGSLNTYTLGNP